MLSVLIVNWKTRDLLRSCLASIQRFPPDCDYEVIVVDNDSGDGSLEMVSEEFPWAKAVDSGSNLGYAAGNNLAFSLAKGDVFLTLNADTEFEDHSINNCLRFLKDNPSVGVLGPRLVGPDKTTQKSVRGFPTIFGVFGALSRLDKVFPRTALGSYSLPAFDYERDGPAPQPMGTFLMFSSTALKTVGDPKKPFDESFPIFFNEVDLLKRLADAGWRCHYLASAHVLHHHGASTRQVRKSMIWESHNSLVRYLGKHTTGAARVMLPAVAALAWVAAFVRAKGHDAGFRAERNDL